MSLVDRDELREIVREVLDEQQQRVGLSVETGKDRDELKADALFVRRLREAANGAATKLGYAVLMSAAALVAGILVTGWHATIGR